MEPTTRHSLVLRLRNPDDEAAWAEFPRIPSPLSANSTKPMVMSALAGFPAGRGHRIA